METGMWRVVVTQPVPLAADADVVTFLLRAGAKDVDAALIRAAAMGKVAVVRAFVGVPKIKRHLKGSQANCTPAPHGKRVVACFGPEGLYRYDCAGKLLWK